MIRRFSIRAGMVGLVFDRGIIRSPCNMAAFHSGRRWNGEISVTRTWVTEPSRRPVPPLRPLFERLLVFDAKCRKSCTSHQFQWLQGFLPAVSSYPGHPDTPWGWLVDAGADWGWDDVVSVRVGGPQRSPERRP